MSVPDWITQEPVLWTTVAGAAITAAVAFGVPITPEQKTAVLAVVGAVLALFVRSQVSPTTPPH